MLSTILPNIFCLEEKVCGYGTPGGRMAALGAVAVHLCPCGGVDTIG